MGLKQKAFEPKWNKGNKNFQICNVIFRPFYGHLGLWAYIIQSRLYLNWYFSLFMLYCNPLATASVGLNIVHWAIQCLTSLAIIFKWSSNLYIFLMNHLNCALARVPWSLSCYGEGESICFPYSSVLVIQTNLAKCKLGPFYVIQCWSMIMPFVLIWNIHSVVIRRW